LATPQDTKEFRPACSLYVRLRHMTPHSTTAFD
jgi:hypothetical protein